MYLGCLFSFSWATVAAAALVSRLECTTSIDKQGAERVFLFALLSAPNLRSELTRSYERKLLSYLAN